MNSKPSISAATAVLFASLLFFGVSSLEPEDIIFFHLFQQWPGTKCGGERGCCYPKTGKPASGFVIHSMRPEVYWNRFLKNCDSKDQLNPSSISGMTSELQEHWPYLDCPSRSSMSLWKREWKTYGTCGKSMLNQTEYFKAALNLKKQVNFLDVLIKAGIKPDGRFYKLDDASEALQKAIGYEPGIFCIKDKSGNSLLNFINGCAVDGTRYICSGTMGKKSNCGPSFKFPPFKIN